MLPVNSRILAFRIWNLAFPPTCDTHVELGFAGYKATNRCKLLIVKRLRVFVRGLHTGYKWVLQLADPNICIVPVSILTFGTKLGWLLFMQQAGGIFICQAGPPRRSSQDEGWSGNRSGHPEGSLLSGTAFPSQNQ